WTEQKTDQLGSKVQSNKSVGQQTRDFVTPGNDAKGQSQGIADQVADLAAGAAGQVTSMATGAKDVVTNMLYGEGTKEGERKA
ncbi:MAG: hypothetical protein TREMPRED_000001, partial [Tremellales sp. Tagirdzhanova-0007]